ncbi:hypothetical protein SeMB42_g00077 [Synchytrium endobioticum]|uniref:GDT1 family protein n=1 Tax=Synchytrium endobioticum TaxID=286115 RepID=A0A507DL47_9FUNG|nr:hypothetical protein SeLEV6574_g00190 [Synchytrium endobioticum]TPX54880.1 hypothetical protein SeMB42_g00077 [Synchytrium endobioticum]
MMAPANSEDLLDDIMDAAQDEFEQERHAIIWSFLVIVVSEIGDKTFFIAAIMAMKNPRLLIFSSAMCALGIMTVLSALLGHTLPTLFSKQYTQMLAALLFIIFGLKMLKEAYTMTGKEGLEELEEVSKEIEEKEMEKTASHMEKGIPSGSTANGLAHDVPPTPIIAWEKLQEFRIGLSNLVNWILTPVFVETFVLTFLAEWGDRSQIATIALASAENFWWVTIGTLVGHSICSAMAVIGGRMLATRISVKTVTLLGGVLFLVFGFVSSYEAWDIGAVIAL